MWYDCDVMQSCGSPWSAFEIVVVPYGVGVVVAVTVMHVLLFVCMCVCCENVRVRGNGGVGAAWARVWEGGVVLCLCVV